MDATRVRGLINQIVFDIDYEPDLSDEAMIERYVDAMINRRYFGSPVEEYAEAMHAVLRDGHLPRQALVSERYPESELLAFLGRLARHLDGRRPWPRPPFVRLGTEQWASFAGATPIASIDTPMSELQAILNGLFETLPAGAGSVPVILLELRSGQVVAVAGPADARSGAFTLLQRDPGDPAEVIARFCEFTGLSPHDVVPIPD
jgi:hypothetical protein